MICSKVGIALALALLASTAHSVHAQPTFVLCEGVSNCANRFLEAQQLSKSGSFEKALKSFKELYQKYNDPLILYPIAALLQHLGHHSEAIPFYQQYLDSGVETDPSRIAQVQAQLHQARTDKEAKSDAATLPQSSASDSLNLPKATIPETIPEGKAQRSALPLYKRWWLWTGIGIVAAGIVIGATLGSYARQPDWSDALQYRPFP